MLWTYDSKRGVARPSKPQETGASSNFYSVKTGTGEWDDRIDEWLREIESRAGPGYLNLLNLRIPNGQERWDMAAFVATQHLRSPSLVRAAADAYGKMIQLHLNMEWSDRLRFEKSMDRYERDHGPMNITRDELWTFHNNKDTHKVSLIKSAA